MDIEQTANNLSQMHIDHARILTQIAGALSTSGESGVLLWLNQHDGAYAMDIVEHFGLTAGRVANIVRQLEKRQFIFRQTDAEDLRRTKIFLTEEGKHRASGLFEEMNAGHAHLLDALGEEDATTWIRLLDKLIHLADNEDLLQSLRK